MNKTSKLQLNAATKGKYALSTGRPPAAKGGSVPPLR